MEKAIREFFSQFGYKPEAVLVEKIIGFKKFLVCGMGGSHFAADFLMAVKSDLDLIIHKDYGLPKLADEAWKDRLVICSSYSGNTEEVVEAFREAKNRGLPLAVVSVGGKLLELASESVAPYVKLLDTGIQPRSALGSSFLGLAKLMGLDDVIGEAVGLVGLRADDFREEGKALALKLKGKVPVICSSTRNGALAFNWKIGFNETAKIPAFYNVFPELNHNEMTGFDVKEGTKGLSQNFVFVFLKDDEDLPKIQKRMEITKKLYEERGFTVLEIALKGSSRLEKIFISSVIADWTAYHLGDGYGVDTEQVPMVEEFKKLVIS